MPNSSTVDERVVRMRMDNDQFEKGATKTLGTIEKLNEALNFKKVGDLGASAIEKSLDKIQNKFSALEVAGRRTVERLTDGFLNLAKQAATGADSIKPGFGKYEQQIASVQKLMIATGESMENVQKVSDKILEFTDETSYEYEAMLNTMSSFTSSGMGMDDAANTILGMAIAAGQAGVNAKDATHAFMGFQKAIASGYMGSAQWDWIRTAGMNSAELKKQLLEAAVATGDLQKGADGVYYAIKESKKGAQQIAITVENFEQSFANKWLSGEAIEKAMGKYSKAFNQIMEIRDRLGENAPEIFEIIGDDSPYLQYLDEYSLAAFKAGQETKTWSDAVEALKSAMSSGWMKSFELIIGNYEEASGFFSDLIEPLYEIFVAPGKRRNSFLEAAFGESGKTTKTVVNWNKLKNAVEATGHSMDELEDSFKKITSSSNNEAIRGLGDNYRDLEEAIKNGAISGDLLNQILNETAGLTTEATAAAIEGAVDATSALEQYKQVAMEVLRGDYGNGQERRDAIEAMGLDFDTVQWLVGNLNNGVGFDAISLEWFESTAPNAYQHFIDVVGNGNYVINGATGELIALSDVVDEIGDQMASMTGRELWQGGILNIATAISDALGAIKEAFDEVFGSPEERGRGVRAWLESFYRMTLGLEMTDERLEKVKKTAKGVFQFFGGIGYWVKTLFKAAKQFSRLPLALLDKLLSLFTGGHNINHEFGTLGSVLERISIIVQKISKWIRPIFDKAINGVDDVIKKLKDFSFKEFFKPVVDFYNSDSPIATFLRTVIEPFNKLFSGEGSLMEKISGFFSGFNKNTEDMTKSMDNVTDSVRGMTDIFSGVLDGDETTLKDKIGKLWENIKKFVSEKYKEINWSNVIDVGKMGLVGYLFVKLSQLFTTMNKSVKTLTQNGPFGAIQTLVNNFSAPFVALGKSIDRIGNAQRYLIIAAAIGILAASIWALSKIPSDDFYNVTVVLGILMAIMAKMAKNMNGFSLFSNNTKTKSKNNPINNTIKAFENLTSAFSVDFKGNKFNFNLFSNAMQVMIGIAVLITAVLNTFMKIRGMDIKDIHDLDNELVVFGILIGTVAAIATVLTLASGEAKYGTKAAILILALAKALDMITTTFLNLATAMAENQQIWPHMLTSLFLILTIFAVLGALMYVAGQMSKNTVFGNSFYAIAASIIAIAVAMSIMVKALDKITGIKNVGQGLAVMAGLALGLVAVMAVLDALAKGTDTGAKGILALSGAMLVLAIALLALTPALAVMSMLDPVGMLAGAAALGIMLLALAGMATILSKIDTKKLLVVSVVMGLLVLALGALLLAIGSFTATMVGLAQLPWVQLKANFQAMHDVLSPELPLFIGLGLAAAMFGIGLLGAAAAGGVFGLSFLAIAAGIYLVAAALPMLIDGIIYFVDRVNENGWKLVEFIGLLLTAIMIVMIARKAEFLAVVSEYATGVLNLLRNGKFIKNLLGVLGVLLLLGVDFINKMVGPIVEKLIMILVTLINSLADAIRNNKGDIAGAIWNLIEALLELIWEVLASIGGGIGKLLMKLKNKIFGDDDIRGGIVVAQALDADHMEIAVDEEGIEAKGKEAGRAAKNALDQGYSDGLSGMDDISLEDIDMMSDADIDAWLSQNGYATEGTTTSDAYVAGNEKGIADGQDLQNGWTDGLNSVFNSGLLGSDLGGDMNSLMGGFGGVIGDGTSLGGGTNVLGSLQNYIGGTFGSQEITDQVTASGEQTGMNWLQSLGNRLTDGLNIENMIGSIGGFVQNTFSSQPTLDNFFNAGTSDGDSTVTGIETYMNGEDANLRMYNTGVNASNQIYYGFTETTDINAPGMVNYLVSGLEVGFYEDENLKERLKSIGAAIYMQVEKGLRKQAGINSPSKAMAENGMYLMMGLANGLEEGSDQAMLTGESTMGSILNAFQQAISIIMAAINDQLTIDPTITPVVDLSNVDSAMANIQNGFNGGYDITTDLSNTVGRQNQRAQQMGIPEARFDTGNEFAGGITVNVYPSAGMDEKALADKVIYRLTDKLGRRRAATE